MPGASTFVDTGQIIDILAAIQVPRAGNVGEDHSTLPKQPQVSTLTLAAAWTVGSIQVTINGRSYTQAFSTDQNTSVLALSNKIAGDKDVASSLVVAVHTML